MSELIQFIVGKYHNPYRDIIEFALKSPISTIEVLQSMPSYRLNNLNEIKFHIIIFENLIILSCFEITHITINVSKQPFCDSYMVHFELINDFK